MKISTAPFWRIDRVTMKHSDTQSHAAVTATMHSPADGSAETHRTSFVAPREGAPGPVVMVATNGSQAFVTDPGRFGDRLDASWVCRFFACPGTS